jgi:glucose/arabinose dehydrogenase
VGVTIGPDGASLLVADDVGDVVWRVTGVGRDLSELTLAE